MSRRSTPGLRRSVAACALAVAVAVSATPAVVSADSPEPPTEQPPVETPAPDTPVDDSDEVGEVDGAIVAVGTPPVPPAPPVGEPVVEAATVAVSADRGDVIVAVGLPPVPPEVGEVDGAIVAVGQPPVPQAPSVASQASNPAPRPTPSAAPAPREVPAGVPGLAVATAAFIDAHL